MADETSFHGNPCWYELGTSDVAGAEAFYGRLLGWTGADAGIPGMEYHLETAPDGGMVAGMMDNSTMPGSPPPAWCVYYAVDDCDATVEAATAAGGSVCMPATDIPETGRIAVLADPHGAVFGVLQPEPMDGPPPGTPPFAMGTTGHGGWHELMTPDPEAALEFYAGLFGWQKDVAMEMPEGMGTYQIIARAGQQFGAVMGQGNSPVPAWLPYFCVENTDTAIGAVKDAGGQVLHGPIEVPMAMRVAIATDPQGAAFAVLGS
ncbi:MAG: VOC family protein [Thermoleophilia bacterium]|nr:VOC family protein [Thermoleophilia bacterium]